LIRSEPNVLLGYEGHGAIQFPGIHSALSWRVDGAEDWHGFTVGIPVAVATAVPEGGTTLSGLAVAGLAFRLWSRRKRGQS
jgi:hypothetical protein